MFSKKRNLAADSVAAATSSEGRSQSMRACAPAEQGQALVELALALPFLLVMVTGIFSFGLYMQQDMQLTDAVAIAGKQLAVSRGNTSDPCNQVYTTVIAAAPYLSPASMNFSYAFNGTAYSGTSCSSGSSTTGAAGNLVQGQPASITVTYPCNLTIYYAVLVSSGTCMRTQITEMVQ